MALLFMDGFDYYSEGDAVPYGKWTGLNGVYTYFGSAYARNGVGQGVLLNSSPRPMSVYFPAIANTFIFGGATKLADIGTPITSTDYMFLQFYDDSDFQIGLRINPDWTISAINGSGTVLGTSTSTVTPLDWFHVEVKILLSPTVGTVEVRINGDTTPWINVTSVATQVSSTAQITRLYIGLTYNSLNHYWDDVYLCDTTGSTCNDFLGEKKIVPMMPNGAGNYTQWTPSTGANWENVDETNVDGDATYNSHATDTEKDSYALSAVSSLTGRTVSAIAVNTIVKKDDISPKSARPFIRTNSTDHPQTDIALTDDYKHHQDIIEINPNTSAAWTESELNALESGIEVTS